MRHLLPVALVASTLVLATSRAPAATITETASISGSTAFDIGQDVFVPQFDPTLGMLTGAQLSLTGTLTPGVAVTANSPIIPTTPIEFNPVISIDLARPDLVTIRLPGQSVIPVNGIAIGASETIDFATPVAIAALPVVSPTELDFYTSADNGYVPLPPGDFVDTPLGSINAQLALTYTYTPTGGAPVPEPASLALLGAGLLGLGGLSVCRTRLFAALSGTLPASPKVGSSRADRAVWSLWRSTTRPWKVLEKQRLKRRGSEIRDGSRQAPLYH